VLEFESSEYRGERRDCASLSHTNATLLREESWSNIHAHKFLEEQLRRIRDVHLCDFCLVLAGPTLERLLLKFTVSVSLKMFKDKEVGVLLTQLESSTHRSRTHEPGMRR